MPIAAALLAAALGAAPAAGASSCETVAGLDDVVSMPRTAGPSLEELYRSGLPFREFLETAERRRARWLRSWKAAAVPADLLARAERLRGEWRILAVAFDGCSDSIAVLPWVARLAEAVERLDLRVVGPDAGRELMETHRTPDGRAATPTLLVLDGAGEEAGCWVERPAALQAWAIDARPRMTEAEFVAEKTEWYRNDGGRSILAELLQVLEAAEAGAPACDAGAPDGVRPTGPAATVPAPPPGPASGPIPASSPIEERRRSR